MGEGGDTRRRRATASLWAALAAAAALGSLAALVFRGAAELARLESRNEAERHLNALLGSLRDHEDFGAAIEASSELVDKVLGVAIYGERGELLYSWGSVPASYSRGGTAGSPAASGAAGAGGAGEVSPDRLYLERGRDEALALVLRTSKLWPPPPPRPPGIEPGPRLHESPDRSTFFDLLRRGEYLYLELRQAGFFGHLRLLAILFPLCLACLLVLSLGARRLILRNAEYRERIEEQKNLVVLGTAASTLAHEIKNPLLAIRLQTSLLCRSLPGERRPELDVIESEVERLAALSRRVGDYLRDPVGFPVRVDADLMADEVSQRLLGRRAIPVEGDCAVLVDPERLRSMLENLLRNALESGGPEEEVAIRARRAEGWIAVEVVDRGRGLEEADPERLFDPFYTTKSRGTGIGLAISRRFARAAGGEISLDKREGGGTRALLVLPPDPEGGAPGGAYSPSGEGEGR